MAPVLNRVAAHGATGGFEASRIIVFFFVSRKRMVAQFEGIK
jgi:hypothetical protein